MAYPVTKIRFDNKHFTFQLVWDCPYDMNYPGTEHEDMMILSDAESAMHTFLENRTQLKPSDYELSTYIYDEFSIVKILKPENYFTAKLILV